MFAEHQPLIREYAMQSADHTADVGYFVLATIQQQFSVVRLDILNPMQNFY